MQDASQGETSSIISVEQTLQLLDIQHDKLSTKIEHLSDGLTNDNKLITLHKKDEIDSVKKIVLRRFYSKTSKHLGYDRDQEYQNSCLVAEVKKVGAEVIGYVPPCRQGQHGGALALKYIESNTLDEKSMKLLLHSSKGISLLVDTLKRLHGLPSVFKNVFDPFKARIFYEEQIRLMTGKDVVWPTYSSIIEKLSKLESYLKETREELVDCHNDLLSANFLLSSDNNELVIVDWELAGKAEPSWELGNFISENSLDEDESLIISLIQSYWSELSEPEELQAKIKRAKMFSLISKITWAAWGKVLHSLDKTNSFNYEEWSMKKLTKAEVALEDKDYINMLMQR